MASSLTGDLTLVVAAQRTSVSGNVMQDGLTITDKAFDELFSQFMEVDNLTTDLAVSLGPLTTGQQILILSDQTVSFKLNSSTTAISCTTLFLDGASLTSLSVSNSSGSQAHVRIYMLGT